MNSVNIRLHTCSLLRDVGSAETFTSSFTGEGKGSAETGFVTDGAGAVTTFLAGTGVAARGVGRGAEKPEEFPPTGDGKPFSNASKRRINPSISPLPR